MDIEEEKNNKFNKNNFKEKKINILKILFF